MQDPISHAWLVDSVCFNTENKSVCGADVSVLITQICQHADKRFRAYDIHMQRNVRKFSNACHNAVMLVLDVDTSGHTSFASQNGRTCHNSIHVSLARGSSECGSAYLLTCAVQTMIFAAAVLADIINFTYNEYLLHKVYCLLLF